MCVLISGWSTGILGNQSETFQIFAFREEKVILISEIKLLFHYFVSYSPSSSRCTWEFGSALKNLKLLTLIFVRVHHNSMEQTKSCTAFPNCQHIQVLFRCSQSKFDLS